jgi:hypothetical protein
MAAALLLWGSTCPAQSVYRFSAEILYDTSNAEEVSTHLTFTGHYREALRFAGRNREIQSASAQDSAYFRQFRAVSAQAHILRRMESARVILITGETVYPQHSFFVQSLLKDLHKAGFRYLACEAVDAEDSLLNRRRYPVSTTGFRVSEPRYGQLVRSALKTGFRVMPYDFYADDNIPEGTVGDTIHLDMSLDNRELHQALNLQKLLLKDPEARIVVYCSPLHANEHQGYYKSMSLYLRELTGIDPLSIDQCAATEQSNPALENPFYRMADVRSPSVLEDASGNSIIASPGMRCDITVFHPRTAYAQNRPAWLKDYGNRVLRLPRNKLPSSFPCLVQAFHTGENSAEAVPADVIELKSATDETSLLLPRGSYLIRILNSRGNTTQHTGKAR